jgi:hypothetical protein
MLNRMGIYDCTFSGTAESVVGALLAVALVIVSVTFA